VSGPGRGVVVAVAGAKGSPGCTFVAIALARCLAACGIATLLVDADPQPSMAAMLGIAASDRGPRPGSIGDQSALRSARRSVPAAVAARAFWRGRREPAGLWWMLLPAGMPGGRVEDDRWFGQLASREHGAVVVDVGQADVPAGRHAGDRALLWELACSADRLLWIAVSDRLGLERADRLLPRVARDVPDAGIVLNQLRAGCLDGADRVLSERHRLPVLARLPWSGRLAPGAGGPVPPHRVRGLREPLARLARAIHPGMAPAHRSGGRSLLARGLPWP
jgi:hypothetical protein